MIKITTRQALLLCILFKLPALIAVGQEAAAYKVGDRVLTNAQVTLRVSKKPVEVVKSETSLQIEAVNGKWLWVKSPSGKKGWVQNTKVKPAPRAAVATVAKEPKYDDLAGTDLVPGELVVTVHENVKRKDFEESLKSLGHKTKILDEIVKSHMYLVQVPGDVLHECRLRLGLHPYVEGCGLNTVRRVTRTYDDPALAEDSEHGWNLRSIDAFDAWDITTGGALIAIVDSGIKVDHEEFEGKLTKPYSVYTRSPKMQSGLVKVEEKGFLFDRYITEHGTHVAGTAAGKAGNKLGTAGVAPDSPIMPIQVLSYLPKSKGIYGEDWALIKGLNRAIDEEAAVINYSIGGPPPEEIHNAWLTAKNAKAKADAEAQVMNWVQRRLNDDYKGVLDRAVREGVIITKSAGNDDLPAKFDFISYSGRVISVAATTKKEERAKFSNHGDYTTVSAPGKEVWSAYANPKVPFGSMDGTSMAAPHAAGAVALMKTIDPKLSRKEAADILIKTGKQLSTDKAIGPLINLPKALNELKRRRDANIPRPEPDPPLIVLRTNPTTPALPRDGVAILGGRQPWRNPDVRRLIDLWLAIALPILGDRNPRNGPFFFDRFGRVISIRIVYTILPPGDVTDRYQILWTNARTLASSNFGTLDIFVTNMMKTGTFNPNPAPADKVAAKDDAGDAPKDDLTGAYTWSNGVYAGFCKSFSWKQNGKDAATVTFNMDGRIAPLLRKHGLPATVTAQAKRVGNSYVMVDDPLGKACSAAVTTFEKNVNKNSKKFSYAFKIKFTPTGKSMAVELVAVSSDVGATGTFPGTAKRN